MPLSEEQWEDINFFEQEVLEEMIIFTTESDGFGHSMGHRGKGSEYAFFQMTKGRCVYSNSKFSEISHIEIIRWHSPNTCVFPKTQHLALPVFPTMFK